MKRVRDQTLDQAIIRQGSVKSNLLLVHVALVTSGAFHGDDLAKLSVVFLQQRATP